MLLSFSDISLKSLKTFDCLFSSKYSLNGFERYSIQNTRKLITTRSKFSKIKKQLIVSLRAPKHFKVGRHHVNLESRFVSTIFEFKKPVTITSQKSLYLLPTFSKQLIFALPTHPISKRTKLQLSVEVSFKFLI